MTSWIVGDIHGCARELESLIRALDLGPSDRIVCVGDLFHRGPDPVAVMEILKEHRAVFVLGNHEHAVLRRCGLTSQEDDSSSPPPPGETPASFEPAQLEGDGVPFVDAPEGVRRDVVEFLRGHSGYALRSRQIDGAKNTPDGRGWCVLHAGIQPGLPIEGNSIRTLIGLRRLDVPGRPWWYESYRGPELIVFGHTPSAVPRAWHSGGRLVALGIDTGCVYGGRLTAYSPELDRTSSVRALRTYARPK